MYTISIQYKIGIIIIDPSCRLVIVWALLSGNCMALLNENRLGFLGGSRINHNFVKESVLKISILSEKDKYLYPYTQFVQTITLSITM